MESITCNVALATYTEDKEEVMDGYRQVTGYLYQIHGVSFVLHAAVNPSDKRQFTCSEYFTGHVIKHGKTMQEALDNTYEALRLQAMSPAERVVLKVTEVGYANPPKE